MHEYPPGLMGPIIGMSPDKKAEFPGSQGVCGAGTLPEAESASSPMATSLDRIGPAGVMGVSRVESEDEELTNLNWLHENLLQNFTLGGPEAPPCSGPLFDIEGSIRSPHGHSLSSSSTSSVSSGSPGGERDPLKSKPPFSFSLLIYMAIEQSPSKSLPVKDIYGWILEHFPYFSSAPTGWKNSVRHNLSLNKCFRKVERSLGKTNGKGSLWCVHPEFRPTLMQALKKQHFPNAHAFYTPPASPPSASSPPRHLFAPEQGYSMKESDFDAATAMMLLKSASEQNIDPCDQEGPIDLSRRDLVVVSRDPKQDHTYSSTSVSRSQAPTPRCQAGVSSQGAQAEQETAGAANSSQGATRGVPSGKRARRESRAEVDEELKEAAGSLLHLAGICTSLGASRRKSRKLNTSGLRSACEVTVTLNILDVLNEERFMIRMLKEHPHEGRTQGVPADHLPEHLTSSATLPPSHRASWCSSSSASGLRSACEVTVTLNILDVLNEERFMIRVRGHGMELFSQ